MNLVPIESAVRFGEIIPPGSSVRVIGTTHPLNAISGARIERHLDVGLTIEEMLQEALEDRPDLQKRRDFIVCIDGNLIEEFNRRRVRAKAGTVVTFIPRLYGGNALRMLLVGGTLSVATALIGGGILPAGPIALDALFHPVAG